jgi:hypothetical protein
MRVSLNLGDDKDTKRSTRSSDPAVPRGLLAEPITKLDPRGWKPSAGRWLT